MYCSGCGQALVAGQGFCPRCGLASGLGMPMAGPNPAGALFPFTQVERRVNALAVAWLVYTGLVGLTGLIGLAFANAWMNAHSGGMGHWDGPFYGRRFFHGPEFPFLALRFARFALLVRFTLALAAGVGLLQKTNWGRWVAIVAGCVMLIHFPFGTAIGIWTLVVMLNAQNAAGYQVMARG